MVIQEKSISKEIFFELIQKEWDDFDKNVIVNCINNMQSQVQAYIDANGGYTKY